MVKISHAAKNEKGTYKDGKRGDQTGKEVCIRDWYNRPWNYVLRAKNSTMREKIAYAMIGVARNDKIGYSQLDRNSALLEASKVGYDPSKINVLVNTDCSASVSLACIYAGIPQNVLYKNGNSSTTANLRMRLMQTGLFDCFSTRDYTAKTDKLVRGDILLYENHHVAVVVQTDKTPQKAPSKSVNEVAKEVIDGKWGEGETRRKRLTEAGYDYKTVQAEVNRLLR